MREPCLCGAEDCPVCYPGRFREYVRQQLLLAACADHEDEDKEDEYAIE